MAKKQQIKQQKTYRREKNIAIKKEDSKKIEKKVWADVCILLKILGEKEKKKTKKEVVATKTKYKDKKAKQMIIKII